MPRPLLILGGVAFVLIALGVAVRVMHGMDSPGPIVVLIILGIIFVKTSRALTAPGAVRSGSGSSDVTARIDRLEKRMTDLQDIVLSIDDRLQRSENRTTSPA